MTSAKPPLVYAVTGETKPGGDAAIVARTSRIAFDGSAQSGDTLPGPAGTITNTLKAACELHGEIVAEPPSTP